MSSNPEMEAEHDPQEERKVEPKIIFYCKTCQRVVTDPPRKGKRYEYTCPACKEDRVVFGTQNAISDYFHIKDSHLEKMFEEPNVLPQHVVEARERRAKRDAERQERRKSGGGKRSFDKKKGGPKGGNKGGRGHSKAKPKK